MKYNKEISLEELIFNGSEEELLEYVSESCKKNYNNDVWLESVFDFKIDVKFYKSVTKTIIADLVYIGKYSDNCKYRRKSFRIFSYYIFWKTQKMISKLPLRLKISWYVYYFFIGGFHIVRSYFVWC